ncbi:MAG TPA: antibiotic biosynthesis monooxygenase family protein [bacterium]|jgi:heme-degrading monooxygenase HmoA|nr:antibiotic biosynthesis monooxygenase family protein [bacterium]
MPTIISKNSNLLIFINIFTVEPVHQQTVVDLLKEVTEKRVAHQPGFISSSLHKSQDGKRVIMYAQWRSLEDYRAMRGNTENKDSLERLTALASFEMGAFDVVETFSGKSPSLKRIRSRRIGD